MNLSFLGGRDHQKTCIKTVAKNCPWLAQIGFQIFLLFMLKKPIKSLNSKSFHVPRILKKSNSISWIIQSAKKIWNLLDCVYFSHSQFVERQNWTFQEVFVKCIYYFWFPFHFFMLKLIVCPFIIIQYYHV